ncbi:uncharacterized protein A4U43_C08F24010 [Asparagus officinalis]|nr:uncharacterized protein A4U43_C08F24010 [Asparagus officinalis]
MSVPAFGEWEQHKDGAIPDYSVDFSKIREIRRRNKSHVSIGADEDLFPSDAGSDAKAVEDADVDADPGRAREVNRPILQRPTRTRSPTNSSNSFALNSDLLWNLTVW